MTLFATGEGRSAAGGMLRWIGRVLFWPVRIVWRASAGIVGAAGRLAGWAWSVVRRASRFADGPVAVALFVIAVLGPPGPPFGPPSVLDAVIVGAQVLPLAVVRFRPVPAWGVMVAGNLIGLFLLDPYPVVSIPALWVAIGVVAARVERVTAAQVGVVTSLALLPALWHPAFGPAMLVLLVTGIVIALLFGNNVRARRLAEADRTEAQQQRMILEERSRIARELHDVVAHHMSLIAVQSQSAPRRIADLPQEGIADFGAINAAARDALTEMRRLLSVLRDETAVAERAPQPGIDALPALVDDTAQAGLPVDLRVVGDPRPLRHAVDVSTYRIVQEALTNVRRHAHANSAAVTIEYRATVVRVNVADDGVGDRAGTSRMGHGLTGIGERVAMLGGTVQVGDGAAGGFVVDVCLPTSPTRAAGDLE